MDASSLEIGVPSLEMKPISRNEFWLMLGPQMLKNRGVFSMQPFLEMEFPSLEMKSISRDGISTLEMKMPSLEMEPSL